MSWLKSEILAPRQFQEVKDILESVDDSGENAISTRYISALPTALVANKARPTTARNISEQWLETQEVPDTNIDDDHDDVFYEIKTLTADELEEMREISFAGGSNEEDLQNVFLEEELEPATEQVKEKLALLHAINLLMDNLEICNEFEENSNGEGYKNVGGSEVKEGVNLKKHIVHKEDHLKLLSSLVLFEDDYATQEMLTNVRDNAVRENIPGKNENGGEETGNILYVFWE